MLDIMVLHVKASMIYFSKGLIDPDIVPQVNMSMCYATARFVEILYVSFTDRMAINCSQIDFTSGLQHGTNMRETTE